MAVIRNILQDMADSQLEATNTIVNGFRNFHMDAAKQAIPLFSGEIGGQTVHEWLEKADRVAQVNGWTDAERLRIYQERLTDSASTYNDTLTAAQKETLAHWRTNFTNGFNDAVVKQSILNQLDNITQNKTERVRDFVARINTLYRQAFGAQPADDEAVNVATLRNAKKRTVFLNGLNREIYNLLWYRLPPAAEWDDVVEHATNAETILGKKKAAEDHPESDNAIATVSLQNERLGARLEILSRQINALLHRTTEGKSNMEFTDNR